MFTAQLYFTRALHTIVINWRSAVKPAIFPWSINLYCVVFRFKLYTQLLRWSSLFACGYLFIIYFWNSVLSVAGPWAYFTLHCLKMLPQQWGCARFTHRTPCFCVSRHWASRASPVLIIWKEITFGLPSGSWRTTRAWGAVHKAPDDHTPRHNTQWEEQKEGWHKWNRSIHNE